MGLKNLTKLMAAAIPVLALHAAQADTVKLCANLTSGVVAAKATCGPSETKLVFPTGLAVSSCGRAAAHGGSNLGAARATVSCDANTAFVQEWGFSTNQSGAEATLTGAVFNYPKSSSNVPNGITVSTVSTTQVAYTLTVYATCCKK